MCPEMSATALVAVTNYQLASLKVVYCSKLRDHLQRTIDNLKGSLEWQAYTLPTPQRLPRRAWRVWYLTAPFRNKLRKKHYIFHDWRYSFTFDNVTDPRPIISTALGSMTSDTSCTLNFNWFHPGTQQLSQNKSSIAKQLIQARSKYEAKNKERILQESAGWRQMYRHGNLKQYLPDEARP